MEFRVTSLADCIKRDIHVSINMCQVLNKYCIMRKFCILLVKADYLSHWEVLEELEELNKMLMKS